MKRFHLTERAAHDLAGIVRSAAQVNPQAAEIVARTFLELFELLGRFPTIGSRRLAVTAHPLRLISLYQCMIVYRPESILIEIIAIVPLADEAERLLSDQFNDEVDDEVPVDTVLEPDTVGETVTILPPMKRETTRI